LTINRREALADAQTRNWFTDLGCDVFSGSPAEFGKFVASKPTCARVSKFAGINALPFL
jgi:hypothetical protein